MKLSKNGKASLRVSLSKEDLVSFHASVEDIDYDLPCGRRILSEIFERAREELGFDAEKEKVYIQLYPKTDGGCELFVIRLEEDRQCFFFDSTDAFLLGRNLFGPSDGAAFYRLSHKEGYFVIAPLSRIPPRLSEFGEKWKKLPSSAFLKARCKRLT